MKRILIGLVVVSLVGMIAGEGMAQVQTAGIMRDEYALGLTPTLKSLGMGGAYVGVPGPRSMNPAALGGYDRIEGTLYYGILDHDAGPLAHRGRLDVVIPNPFRELLPLHFFQSAVSRIMIDGVISDSGDEAVLTPGNPNIDFDLLTLGMQTGFEITPWLKAGGGAYPYEKANVDLDYGGGSRVEGEALSQIGSTQLGVMITPHERFNIGGQFIYIKDDLEAKTINIPGLGTANDGDYYHIHYFAIGASFIPIDGTLLALDYWNGEIEGDQGFGNGLFDVDVDRWNFGVEQRVCDYFFVRLGYNNGGITTGFTAVVNDNVDIDFAYANEYMEDKSNIFGQTDYYGISVTARF